MPEITLLDELHETVRLVIRHLVDGRYHELELLTGGERLPAVEMAEAVTEYGRELVMPPLASQQYLDVVEIDGSHPPSWSVVCPLWTREEGRSDLSIELTLTRHGCGFRIVLDGIHVL